MDCNICDAAHKSGRRQRSLQRRHRCHQGGDHWKSEGEFNTPLIFVILLIPVSQARFDIALDPALLHFVFLNSRHMVEDATWPRFTLLGQSLGSMYLAWEAMSKLIPELYIGKDVIFLDSLGLILIALQIPWGILSHSM